MNVVVVDSSVVFKWLARVGESGADEARDLLTEQRSGNLLLTAPTLLHIELANSLRNCRHLCEEETAIAVEELDSFHVVLLGPTPARLAAATRLSYRHGMSIYDALFLALAEELHCPLVTADRRAFARIETEVEIRLL